MEPTEMIKLIIDGTIRVFFDGSEYSFTPELNRNNTFYFWLNPQSYDSYKNVKIDHPDANLIARLSTLTRIEKLMGSEYYPIWTKEDGLITQTENFVRLNGRYYTIQFLEELLDKITDFKRINI
ncbi:MAG TPA: hypothetical protein DCL77_03415 [Prolixibacteraceae bacterium]|jgi:hypothetical protein|nr:hypothetical protein [Prolixibacteraceae bacterium]